MPTGAVPPTRHNTQPSSHTVPMPPKATKPIKSWGQADRDLLEDLTNRQLIDITDTTHQNIETRGISAVIFAIIRQRGTSKLSIAVRNATEVRCGI